MVTYTAAHGHPLEHPEVAGRPRVWTRWRAAVAGAVALGALTLVVLLRPGPSTAFVVPLVDGPVAAPSTAGAPGRDADEGEGQATPGPSGPAGTRGGDGATDGTQDAGRTGSGAASGSGSGPDVASGSGLTTAPGTARCTAEAGVLVHVVGQVRSPGVVCVPDGSRVADAVDAAGGATAEADLVAVNLARPVVDGEQLHVPRPGEDVLPAAGPATAAGVGESVVDLNSADLAALDALPGVGPVLAQRILDHRAEHGPFLSVEALDDVSGVGPALLDDLRGRVRV